MNSHGAPWPYLLIGNVVVDLVERDHFLSLIIDSLSAPEPLAVASANLDHIRHFADDESWRDRPPAVSVVEPAAGMRWLVALDGAPLVRSANSLTGRVWPKLSGSDLIDPILESAAAVGARVGFLGGAEETHRQLRKHVGARLPTLCIAGTWAPSRSVVTDAAASERLAAEIRDAEIDILVVALSKPVQEEWIADFGMATGAKVFLAFGAVVDFLAQRIRRAPQQVANAGAEWAWRLILEPRRLGRRYLIQGPPALLRLKRTARVVEAAIAPAAGDRGSFAGSDGHVEAAALVVTYNSSADLPQLIDDLRAAARDHSIRLIVVDNDSTDGTVDVLRGNDDIILVESGGNLGYAGGINAGMPFIGSCDNILILNPDLTLAPAAITRLIAAAADERVGAVVPLMLDDEGAIYPSLCREPSLTTALGDALLGNRLPGRPGCLSQTVFHPGSYLAAHDVDWATGAALLIPSAVAAEVGAWDESYFLYSEETDFFRRIRATGRQVRFEPSAVVKHRGGGSGTSPAVATLMAVNHVRYIERYHGRIYSALLHAVVVLGAALRSQDAAVVRNRNRWDELPQATKPVLAQQFSGQKGRGSVVVPAYNEASVIKRTLLPLSQAAQEGFIEVFVVCNGCTDDTADVARSVPGIQVLELERGSKPGALNAGDEAATLWPRLYLDADVQITAESVLGVLDRLGQGDVLVASPDSRYDSREASMLVRSYYRVENRIRQQRLTMWRAGAYAVSEDGHRRLGSFPEIIGDDLYVDTRFDLDEKALVDVEPSVRKTPTDVRSLLSILRRHHRGDAELLALERDGERRVPDTGRETALAVLGTIRGPVSAADAAVYLALAVARRLQRGPSKTWERDESSRR